MGATCSSDQSPVTAVCFVPMAVSPVHRCSRQNKKTQSILENSHLICDRRYFSLWLGHLTSRLGDTLHYIALVVWVSQGTGSSLAIAGTVFFEVIPVVLLAPIAGVVIDRLPRKMVLVAADVVRAMLVMDLLLTTEQRMICSLPIPYRGQPGDLSKLSARRWRLASLKRWVQKPPLSLTLVPFWYQHCFSFCFRFHLD